VECGSLGGRWGCGTWIEVRMGMMRGFGSEDIPSHVPRPTAGILWPGKVSDLLVTGMKI